VLPLVDFSLATEMICIMALSRWPYNCSVIAQIERDTRIIADKRLAICSLRPTGEEAPGKQVARR